MADIGTFFTNMLGTLAVILVVSAYISQSDFMSRFDDTGSEWKHILVAGLVGGLFGIYGNLSGVELQGAIISVRDMGPMLAGFTGGPWGGLIGGLIAGGHRLLLGGLTAKACVVATCCIGTFCGALAKRYQEHIVNPGVAFNVGFFCEAFHLGVVLLMVRPFETALSIVQQIAIPFIAINALGFTLMILVVTYIRKLRQEREEKNRLQSELQMATSIQRSVLPFLSERYPACPNVTVAASMDPAKEVGGDFYDVFYVGRDKIAFLVADVSGKGVPAALFMMTAKQTLQGCVKDIRDLPKAMGIVNGSLCAHNEADMFFTLWVGVLDYHTGELHYVSAGHNPPVRIFSEGAELVKCKPSFVVAGMPQVQYREEIIRLSPGDIMYLYTDGVTEAENEQHELLGEERLLARLSGMQDAKPEAVLAAAKEIIDEHVAGFTQFDDITMLAFRWDPEKEEHNG